jgi:hypothetical protein
MKRLTLTLLLALTPLSLQAATHTVYWSTATGGTYTAFPANQSLADWLTYDAALTEGSGANVGRYAMSLNDASGTSWLIFAGTTQPTSWDQYVASVDLSAAIAASSGSSQEVEADVVDSSRTWIAEGFRALNIVEVEEGFIGTFAFRPRLNPATTINTVSAVSITGAATVVATDLNVDRSRTMAHFTVPALTTTGTYTVRVTVTTVDGQTIVTTGTLKVQ